MMFVFSTISSMSSDLPSSKRHTQPVSQRLLNVYAASIIASDRLIVPRSMAISSGSISS